jgi:hypothetical protein
MQPNWAEVVQAIGSIGTTTVAAVGIVFVIYQIKQVNRSVRSNTSELLSRGGIDILRFLSKLPDSYGYFYLGKPAPSEPSSELRYATEIVANYLEDVVMQMETLPKKKRQSWKAFVCEQYARSPIVRDFLALHQNWYEPELLEIVKNVKPLGSDPIEHKI